MIRGRRHHLAAGPGQTKPRPGSASGMRRTTIALVALLLGLVVWVPRQRAWKETRQQLAAARAFHAELEGRLAEARATLAASRQALTQQQAGLDETLAALAQAERALVRVDPESQWSAPPGTWPAWTPASPYVWVRKEMLPQLGLGEDVFTSAGTLRAEAAAVLAVSDEQQACLNATLPGLLAEYHALEVANAERLDQPLPGIEGEGPQVTIRVRPLPEEGARLEAQFIASLQEQLGDQRTDLVRQVAGGWLDSAFSGLSAEPRIISVIRHPNGSYNLSTRTGSGWLSVGVTSPTSLMAYLPAYLTPLFEDVLGSGVAAP